MKNKLLTLTSIVIFITANQLSLANCGNPDCNCDPCYCTDPCCPSNWYVAASGSVAWHNDHKFVSVVGIETDKGIRNYKVGGGATASLGYIFNLCNCWNLRLEGEMVWRRNSLKNENLILIDNDIIISDTTSRAKGYTQDIGLMVNLITDFPIYCNLGGYLGGGIGISFNKLVMSSLNGVVQSPSKSSDELFAWQILTGLFYTICPNIAITAGYRLFATEKVETPSAHIKSKHIPLTQSIDIGLLIRL